MNRRRSSLSLTQAFCGHQPSAVSHQLLLAMIVLAVTPGQWANAFCPLETVWPTGRVTMVFNFGPSGTLTNSNYCGAFCDVVLALQFEIGSLANGATALITVAYSDTGRSVSPRQLSAARADESGVTDDPGTVLTVSGSVHIATSVPALSGRSIALLIAMLITVAGLVPRIQGTSLSRPSRKQ